MAFAIFNIFSIKHLPFAIFFVPLQSQREKMPNCWSSERNAKYIGTTESRQQSGFFLRKKPNWLSW